MHTILNHPLASHRLTIIRDRQTPPKLFRETIGELTTFLAYEALRDLRTEKMPVTTPVAWTQGDVIAERVVIVPILRAGVGMLQAALDALPDAAVGVLGMRRDENTAEPIPYYSKVPPARGDALALVIDPMLATGGSACDAVGQLKKLGYRRIKFLAIVAAPEGIARFEKEHPDVPLYAAAKDQCLNGHFYIVPGVGDAGDRIFGTEENSTLSKLLKAMEHDIMADGRVDIAEAGELLRLARPLVGMSDDFAAFRKILERVCADGIVDASESLRISAILAALADKADAFSVALCQACGRPVSKRVDAGGACPWCGAAVQP